MPRLETRDTNLIEFYPLSGSTLDAEELQRFLDENPLLYVSLSDLKDRIIEAFGLGTLTRLEIFRDFDSENVEVVALIKPADRDYKKFRPILNEFRKRFMSNRPETWGLLQIDIDYD